MTQEKTIEIVVGFYFCSKISGTRSCGRIL